MELIGGYIRRFVAVRTDEEAACAMMLGSTFAGITMMTRLGEVHAMSHPVSAYFGVAHGVANAILLPTVTEFNALGDKRGKYAKIYTLLRKQGIGGIGIPVVTVGDTVRRGQLLVRAEGLGADLHASVDGTVCVVDDTAVVLTASEHQEEGFLPFDEPADVRAAVRAAGLVGMGGAGFPTHVKLDTDLHGGQYGRARRGRRALQAGL